MQQREGFSARTLALSTAAAELGRVILRAGQSGSVRAVLLGNVLATAALVLLAVFVSWNAARLRREQFSSMAFFGLLPLLLWAGWSLGCELYDRMAAVLGAFVVLGSLFCLLGLAGQLEWQHLVMGEAGRSFALPDAFFYPEYFSFPLLCSGKNASNTSRKSALWLPLIPAIISSSYTLGLALLFGAPQGYPGYELLRAWSFGGISRFDAAFLLLWLAAAVFRLCFLVRTARLLCERLAGRFSGTADAEAAR